MSKILKNTTGSIVTITDVGQTVPASGQLTINQTDYDLYAASSDVVTLVGNGTLVVNDGSVDLDISDGIDHIKGIFPQIIDVRLRGADEDDPDDETLDKKITHTIDGDKVRLDVNDPSGSNFITGQFRFDDMNASNGGIARETIGVTTWTDVYEYEGSGKMFGFRITLGDPQKWSIRLLIDDVDCFIDSTNGLSIDDIKNEYDFINYIPNGSESGINLGMDGDSISWSAPSMFPITFNSSVTIKVKSTDSGKKFLAGLVSLLKTS